MIPGASSAVLANGVDTEFYRPDGEPRSPYDVVFTGVMDYLPNVDGCVRFAREVLPRLRQHFDARFTIVGAHPVREVLALRALPGVEVTGFVPDTREYLRRSAICVAPLRIARGIQNKVLEGLAMALPVVATNCAAQGVGGVPGRDYVIADENERQVEAISALMRDPAAARQLGVRGRRFVEEQYSWEVFLRGLDAIVSRHARPARRGAPRVDRGSFEHAALGAART
jgi:glycosyltransferase involved in cell wall biosynthesis